MFVQFLTLFGLLCFLDNVYWLFMLWFYPAHLSPCSHHTEYWTSSPSKAMKKPRMVRNMMALAVSTSPHAPPEIWNRWSMSQKYLKDCKITEFIWHFWLPKDTFDFPHKTLIRMDLSIKTSSKRFNCFLALDLSSVLLTSRIHVVRQTEGTAAFTYRIGIRDRKLFVHKSCFLSTTNYLILRLTTVVVMSSSITMSSSLLGAAVVVVVLLGSGLTATGARARTMGSAKADNTIPGK